MDGGGGGATCGTPSDFSAGAAAGGFTCGGGS
jgi:hypothetical protein